ncbi:hypothetical protein [Virgibacillus doumboii]|uniref:hypothetical protein n=1 Tax=Virgibacillus doumboii TaxID=2697503 RepID=UPI0013E0C79E|nr:hypothetical protein [Virgibacillus doumboii]
MEVDKLSWDNPFLHFLIAAVFIGLLVGIGTTYSFNSTGSGRAAKKFVHDVSKKVYDTVVDGWNKTKDFVSDSVSKIEDFPGFGG